MYVDPIPQKFRHLLTTPEQAAAQIPNGAVLAVSGYTTAGDPKATLLALARRAAAGEVGELCLLSASQLSPVVEDALADAGALRSRVPFSTSPAVRRLANEQALSYVEVPLGKLPRLFAGGAFGTPDVAVVEALALEEDGRLIPTTSVGMTQLFCRRAKKIIVEINEAQPAFLYSLHDVYEEDPLHCGRSLSSPGERIGRPYVQLDPEKLLAVVRSAQPDFLAPAPTPSETEAGLCRNLMAFLAEEFANRPLPPVQTGIGGLSQAILAAFAESKWENLTFFCGALQEGMVELLASGRARLLSGSSLAMNAHIASLLEGLGEHLPDRLVLRSMEVSNGAAAIASVGPLALNTGIEMDLYGNVNSAHIAGRRLVSGIGGGATFAQNASLSVVLMPSVRKGGKIRCIVPNIAHTDIIHHDVDVVISEWGIADLRGQADAECARRILEHCVHPEQRDELGAYWENALSRGGHHPIG